MRVQGPQAGVRLAHAADNVFHGTRPDGVTAGGEGARAQALGEDLDKRDGIGGQAVGVYTEAAAESQPDGPGGVGGSDALRRDTLPRRRLNSAEIRSMLVRIVTCAATSSW